jgi:hypothetical protein
VHQAQLQLLQLGLKECGKRNVNDLLPEAQPVAVGGLKSRSMVATLGVFKARKVSTASCYSCAMLLAILCMHSTSSGRTITAHS